MDAHAVADAVAELENCARADADVVADLVALADARALTGLQAGAEGAPRVDSGERPYDGAGADGERTLALAGAPQRLADDARRLQVAALAEGDIGGNVNLRVDDARGNQAVQGGTAMGISTPPARSEASAASSEMTT